MKKILKLSLIAVATSLAMLLCVPWAAIGADDIYANYLTRWEGGEAQNGAIVSPEIMSSGVRLICEAINTTNPEEIPEVKEWFISLSSESIVAGFKLADATRIANRYEVILSGSSVADGWAELSCQALIAGKKTTPSRVRIAVSALSPPLSFSPALPASPARESEASTGLGDFLLGFFSRGLLSWVFLALIVFVLLLPFSIGRKRSHFVYILASEKGAPDAHIKFYDTGDNLLFEAVSDERGIFRAKIPPGRYRIQIQKGTLTLSKIDNQPELRQVKQGIFEFKVNSSREILRLGLA